MASILELKNFQAHFYTRRGIVKAVDGISYEIQPGETLGIVGESGSGKSVSQLSYLRLLPSPPLKIVGGEVLFHGKDILRMSDDELRAIRGNKVSMIFQEPMTSLNPYMKVGNQLIEPLLIHKGASREDAWKKGIRELKRVGIADAEKAMSKYPHEFSGGMRQRVMIAMALTTDPELLIADEPTTALDVTVQAQILDILKDIQRQTKMAILLITHDLGVIAGLADKVVVMYAGKVFEKGSAADIFERSEHPYTRALLKSTPRIDMKQDKLPVIGGTIADLSKLPPGCPFYDRCDYRMDKCTTVFPEKKTITPAHETYCYAEVKA